MRRSTSLAVCWAPMRMMPRERPRSATSRRISLIGLDPSRGAYLLSSSSTTNCSGRAWPWRSFSSKAWRSTTPTTKRLARSLRLWRSTTVTWASSSTQVGLGVGLVGPDEAARGGRIAPCSRRMKALTVPAPMARPAQRSASRVVLDPVGDDLDQLAERRGPCRRRCCTAPSPRGLGVGGQPGRDVVHDHRVLLAVVLGVGEQERQQLVLAELLDGPEERADARRGGRTRRARRWRRPAGAGPSTATLAEGPGGQAELGVPGPLLVGRAGCWRGRGTAGPRPSR